MVKTTPPTLAAALATAALCLGADAGFAAAAARHTAAKAHCTGTRPEYNPGDLLYQQAGVSASARLALAIRWREYLASCHGAAAQHRQHRG
jgi:hypothetical protein